jgi:hypothetical protein
MILYSRGDLEITERCFLFFSLRPTATYPFPLFVRHGHRDYIYCGTYQEPRYSDWLGGNEMKLLPDHIKKYWDG